MYTCLQFGLFFLSIAIGYILVKKSHSTNNRWAGWFALLVWLLGAILYGYIYSQLDTYGLFKPSAGWLPLIVTSAISSAQLFFGSTHIFDNGYFDWFFSEDGLLSLICLTFISITALSLSAFVLFNLIIKRFSSKVRLLGAPNNRNVHIFFGNNAYSQLLAHNIHDTMGDNAKIIIIEYPKKNEPVAVDDSLIGGLFKMFTEKRSDDSFIYLRSQMKLTQARKETKVEDILDIRGLDKWIFRNQSSLYFLSDDEIENKHSLEILKNCVLSHYAEKDYRIGCVYCHAKKDELRISEEDYYRAVFNVTFIDSSSLAIRQILREDLSSAPINFVNIPAESVKSGEDDLSEECRLGYVDSDFNAAVIGFGELGHDAFDFLYEYGSFSREVTVNKKRAVIANTWHLYVFDKEKKERKERLFKNQHPGFDCSKISFIEMDVEDDSQWCQLKKYAPTLNYIFVCTGNDELNLKTLVKIDECFDGINIGKLRIMVKYSKTVLNSIFFNQLKNISGCFRFFGIDEDIWKHSIISDEVFVSAAKQFATSYMMCADKKTLDSIIDSKDELKKIRDRSPEEAIIKAGDLYWRNRDEEIARPCNTTDRLNLLRLKSQDMANTWHRYTKEQLIGTQYLKNHASHLAQLIPIDYNAGKDHRSSHAPEATPFELDLLENLAVCEHLRWNASHIARGYQYGATKSSIDKTHNCIKDYFELDGTKQHYDWLVVKTTLEMFDSNPDA